MKMFSRGGRRGGNPSETDERCKVELMEEAQVQLMRSEARVSHALMHSQHGLVIFRLSLLNLLD